MTGVDPEGVRSVTQARGAVSTKLWALFCCSALWRKNRYAWWALQRTFSGEVVSRHPPWESLQRSARGCVRSYTSWRVPGKEVGDWEWKEDLQGKRGCFISIGVEVAHKQQPLEPLKFSGCFCGQPARWRRGGFAVLTEKSHLVIVCRSGLGERESSFLFSEQVALFIGIRR